MMDWIKRGRWMVTVAAVLAAAVPAMAQPGKPPPPAPVKAADKAEKAADKADKAADKADKAADKADKAADKADKAADKAEDKAEKVDDAAAEKLRQAKQAAKRADRTAKSKTEKAALRARVVAALKGHPMTQAMTEEVKNHARRLARLERVKDLAEDAKDTDAVARVDKLIAKENARHEGWMTRYDAKTDKAGAK